ncbi:MAG: DoxX family protein [Muribaculaceae bacterium]|nr:DoxX family protein [Muribaculaceae bacterium]
MEKAKRRRKILEMSIVGTLRVLVGALFIFSGFVKAIDPWGSLYKFEEYINVLGFEGLLPLVSFLAIVVGAFEFVLGVFILLGCYRRVAPILLLLMMLIMLPLTLYIAVTDAVGNCGCFGDVVDLSNWATFIKNIFITAGLVYLLLYNKRLKNIYGAAVQWIVVLLSSLFILIIAFIGYFYQPLLDFRPFKDGGNLIHTIDKEKVDDGDNYVFIYERAGEKKEFTVDSLPSEEWTFVDRYEKAKELKVDHSELVISKGGEDITQSIILAQGEQVIFLFPNLSEVEISYTYVINEINEMAQSRGISVVGLTSADSGSISEWRDISMASYPMYIIDDSVLKQIARGNPAIVYLKDGVVQWKRTMRSIPVESLVSGNQDLSEVVEELESEKWLLMLTILYLGSMMLLLIINRSHKVINFRRLKDSKNQNKSVTLRIEKDNK